MTIESKDIDPTPISIFPFERSINHDIESSRVDDGRGHRLTWVKTDTLLYAYGFKVS